MRPSEKRDLRELEVYKMLERLGIELGAGVIPRYGLMYVSAVRNCRSCDAVPACAAWLGAALNQRRSGFLPQPRYLFGARLLAERSTQHRQALMASTISTGLSGLVGAIGRGREPLR
jgi:hypothetical protein